MKKNRSRGFTLIELLVVIAIIGILSAVVLASLSTARSKGQDASIQSDLSSIQTEAEIFYGGTGGNTYGTAGATNSCTVAGSLFAADSVIAKAIQGITSAGSASVTCNNSTTQYAIQAKLVNGVTVSGTLYPYWCVDNSGAAKPEANAMVAGATACL